MQVDENERSEDVGEMGRRWRAEVAAIVETREKSAEAVGVAQARAVEFVRTEAVGVGEARAVVGEAEEKSSKKSLSKRCGMVHRSQAGSTYTMII